MSSTCRNALLTLALLGFCGTAGAQKLELPKIPLTKGVTSKIEPRVPLELGAFQHDFAGGDLATFWISPVLVNHDSRMSNNLYMVSGHQRHQKFGFSVVNPSLEPLEVSISCQNTKGEILPKYSVKLTLVAYGAADWDVNNIAPERTTDSVTADADSVWCGLTANRPFAAFGTKSVSAESSSINAVTLTAAAR